MAHINPGSKVPPKAVILCKFCNDDINIKTMGNIALTSHQKGKKHM